MLILSIILISLYAISAATVMVMGLHPGFPWTYILSIGLLPIPLAYYVVCGGGHLEKYLGYRLWLLPVSGMILGLLLVTVYRFELDLFFVIWVVTLVFMVWHFVILKFTLLKPLLICFCLLLVGFSLVRNLNYIALSLVLNRLQDATLCKADMAIYGFLWGSANYQGIFPLAKSRFLFNFLQNAYFMLFFEIYVIIFLILEKRENMRRFLSGLFACYLLGIIIFLAYPAVGPYVCFPESFVADYHGTLTYKVMRGIVSGYDAIKQSTTPSADIGYFVSFPSLHVALAVLLQYFLSCSKFHFWMFLPVNVLITVSTVFLGFHYLLDIPAGALVALVVIWSLEIWKRQGVLPPQTPPAIARKRRKHV